MRDALKVDARDEVPAAAATGIDGGAVVVGADPEAAMEVMVAATAVAAAVDEDAGKKRLRVFCKRDEKGRRDAAFFICYRANRLKRKPFEDCFRDVLDRAHDVPPDLRSVENVGRPALERVHDIASYGFRVGKMGRLREMICHRRLYWAGFDRDDLDAGGMKTAAKSLQEE